MDTSTPKVYGALALKDLGRERRRHGGVEGLAAGEQLRGIGHGGRNDRRAGKAGH